MAYLRHASRHIHETVYQHMSYHIGALGWTSTVTPLFGGVPVRMQSVMPKEYDQLSKLSPGLLGVTIGDVDDDVELELGGGLTGLDIPFFFDCYMDTEASALALADDVRDILKGRVTGTSQLLTVYNHTATVPVAQEGWYLVLTDVQRFNPQRVLDWQVVNATYQLQWFDGWVAGVSGTYPSASLFPSAGNFPGV